MLNPETIRKELAKLSLNYPFFNKSPKELFLLAEIWREDLEEMGDQKFVEAVKYWRKHNNKPPTSADILKTWHSMPRNQPSQDALQIEEGFMSREENQAKFKELRALLKLKRINNSGNRHFSRGPGRAQA